MGDANLALLRGLFDGFNQRDVPAQLALLLGDYDWCPAFTGGGLLEGHTYRRHEGFRAYLRQFGEAE